MEIEEYLVLKRELEENVGKEKLENVTNEVTEIIKKYNFDVTPNVIEDILKYIKLNILISRI